MMHSPVAQDGLRSFQQSPPYPTHCLAVRFLSVQRPTRHNPFVPHIAQRE